MTFLEKFNLLKKSIPVPALMVGPNTVDCEYVDFVYSSKNCYYCFDAVQLTNSIYTTIGWGNTLVDCLSVTESERCYECVDSNNCYNCTYLLDSNRCTDCHFSAFLNSCSDCFGCVALTHKKYCIFNKQYTKSEYFKEINKLRTQTPETLFNHMLELKKTIPHAASQQFNTENSSYGDYIYNSQNSYWSFNSYYCENSGYGFVSGIMKNSWDMFFSGGDTKNKAQCQLCYEFVDSSNCYGCAFLTNCGDCTNCYYSAFLEHCSDCLGCVGLTNKKYCILNNQLSKHEYEEAVRDINKELGWKNG